MTGSIRKATLLGVCGVLAAATAVASVPSPATSIFPGSSTPGGGVAFIRVVGKLSTTNNNSHPAAGTFTVTIKDFAGNPVVSSKVDLNFINCTDLNLCSIVPTGTAETIDCPNKIISATTNALGQATFAPMGAANNIAPGPVAGPGPTLNCIQILASGVLLGTATAVDFDQNGGASPAIAARNGVDGVDQFQFGKDLNSPVPDEYRGRSDYSAFSPDGCGGPSPDCGGNIDGLDFYWFGQLDLLNGNAALAGCATTGTPPTEGGFVYCTP